MRKVIILLIMCTMSLSAFAQGWWEYKNGLAIIRSSFNDITGDYINTNLTLYIGKDDSNKYDVAACVLAGEYDKPIFRKKQNYVLVEDWKFDISMDDNIIWFDDASSLIDLLRLYNKTFYISLPIEGVGVASFFFDPNGYPLDW